MKKIKLTEEQKQQHPFVAEIVDIFNNCTEEELLDAIDNYILEIMTYSADLMNKELLLGNVSLYPPFE